MNDLTAIYDEDATAEETLDAYQALVDSGQAWCLEGAVGREAMRLIEEGQIALGPTACRDYWGNVVPGRGDVEPGTKGSVEYVLERSGREIS